MIIAGVVGALYGLGIMVGLQVIVDVFAKLPVNFLSNLGKVGDPIIAAFAVFPAIVVGYQYGVKHGLFHTGSLFHCETDSSVLWSV